MKFLQFGCLALVLSLNASFASAATITGVLGFTGGHAAGDLLGDPGTSLGSISFSGFNTVSGTGDYVGAGMAFEVSFVPYFAPISFDASGAILVPLTPLVLYSVTSGADTATMTLSSGTVYKGLGGDWNVSAVGVLSLTGFDDTAGTFAYTNQGDGSVTFSAQSSVVPLPAAAWLFGSALLGLVGIKRRKA